jgi:hypothetical protein
MGHSIAHAPIGVANRPSDKDVGDYDPVAHVCSCGFDAATTSAICGGNTQEVTSLLDKNQNDTLSSF